jgi:separase
MRPTRQTSYNSRNASRLPYATTTSTSAVSPESTTLPSTDALASRVTTRVAIEKGKTIATRSESKGVTQATTKSKARRPGTDAVAEVEVDVLAGIVERKLVIEPKSAKSKEEICERAMRAVNAASKNLSMIVETGWKSSGSGEPSSSKKSGFLQSGTTVTDVEQYSKSIREGLRTLREHRPGDMDVERAACSAAGKLITLESVSKYELSKVVFTKMLYNSINLL